MAKMLTGSNAFSMRFTFHNGWIMACAEYEDNRKRNIYIPQWLDYGLHTS